MLYADILHPRSSHFDLSSHGSYDLRSDPPEGLQTLTRCGTACGPLSAHTGQLPPDAKSIPTSEPAQSRTRDARLRRASPQRIDIKEQFADDLTGTGYLIVKFGRVHGRQFGFDTNTDTIGPLEAS